MYEMMNEINRAFDEAASGCDEAYDEAPRELAVFDCKTLLESNLVCGEAIVNSLIGPGLCVLAGAPKAGKSWLVMDMCLCVAQGKPFWGMRTKKSVVLYLALEDTPSRLQQRITCLTDEAPENLFFSTECSYLGELEDEIRSFCISHIGTRLVVIDTFQKIRRSGREMSYANDYSEVSSLKKLADDMQICILLVHHTRKLADSDYMNEISGTNGIAGSADTLMVLKRNSRGNKDAVFRCTGRDIEDRELKLEFDRGGCRWKVRDDSADSDRMTMPAVLEKLVEYMKLIKKYEGGNTEFANAVSDYAGCKIKPSSLKYKMNGFRRELRQHGVEYVDTRTNTERTLLIMYDKNCDKYKDEPAEEPLIPDSAPLEEQPEEPAPKAAFEEERCMQEDLFDYDYYDRINSLIAEDCPEHLCT